MASFSSVVHSIGAMFVLLAAFWLIGAVAGGIWWRYGVEARDVSLEELTRKRARDRGRGADDVNVTSP